MTRVQPNAQWVYICGKGNDDGRPYAALIDADGALITAGGGGAVDASDVTYTPAIEADWLVIPNNVADSLDELAARDKDLETLLPQSPYPLRANIDAMECIKLTGNDFALYIDTLAVHNYQRYQNAAANGDEFTWSWNIAAGNYAFSILGRVGSSQGIQDIYCKHSSGGAYVAVLSGIDWYAAAYASNILKTGNITITISGINVMKSKVNGKNGSSAGYGVQFSQIWLRPATD